MRLTQEMDPEDDDEALASHFDRMNDYTDARTAVGELAGDELYEYIQNSGDAVVSFSHFLPRCVYAPLPRPISGSLSSGLRLSFAWGQPTVGPVRPGRGATTLMTAHRADPSMNRSWRSPHAHPPGGNAGYTRHTHRLELLPEKRFLFFPNLAKVVGSTMLGERVAQLRPDVHIFGHTHFGWCVTLNAAPPHHATAK